MGKIVEGYFNGIQWKLENKEHEIQLQGFDL